MEDAATIVSNARINAGLSRKLLARRAGVPTSTVSRVEDGGVDPTTTTLRRLLSAAGQTLELEASTIPRGSLAALFDAIDSEASGTTIDWTRIRGFLDAVHAHPAQITEAITTPPSRSGNDLFDNLLAAIAETLAANAGIPRPRWCATVNALDTPWEAPGTPRMRELAHRTAPPQFKARNIWLARRDLWREHD